MVKKALLNYYTKLYHRGIKTLEEIPEEYHDKVVEREKKMFNEDKNNDIEDNG